MLVKKRGSIVDRYSTAQSEGGDVLWGFVTLLGLLVFFLVYSGAAWSLIDLPSLVLVFGGTLGATLLTFSRHDILTCLSEVWRVCTTAPPCLEQRVNRLLEVAKRARREGMLVLEREAGRERDEFFKNALALSTDEQSPERLRVVLMTEINTSLGSMARSARVLQAMAGYAPAIGFVGTLLGLLTMLQTLGDASKVGPAMALALVATLYGTLLAHVIFVPLASKLRVRAEDELHVKKATLEGLVGLVSQENAVLIEQRISAFLRE